MTPQALLDQLQEQHARDPNHLVLAAILLEHPMPLVGAVFQRARRLGLTELTDALMDAIWPLDSAVDRLAELAKEED